MNGYRKFVVVLVALVGGVVIAMTRDAATLSAFSGLATLCVGAYMAVHGIADSKLGNNGKGNGAQQ